MTDQTGASDEPSDPTVEIHVRPDGSYKVYGPVRVYDVDARAYDLTQRTRPDPRGGRIKLCRCGASREMPWCDDSHVEAGFTSRPRIDDVNDAANDGGDA